MFTSVIYFYKSVKFHGTCPWTKKVEAARQLWQKTLNDEAEKLSWNESRSQERERRKIRMGQDGKSNQIKSDENSFEEEKIVLNKFSICQKWILRIMIEIIT